MSAQADKITNWVAPNDKTGEFKRGQSQFRDWIKRGGEFPPEKGRYHLYVSTASFGVLEIGFLSVRGEGVAKM